MIDSVNRRGQMVTYTYNTDSMLATDLPGWYFGRVRLRRRTETFFRPPAPDRRHHHGVRRRRPDDQGHLSRWSIAGFRPRRRRAADSNHRSKRLYCALQLRRGRPAFPGHRWFAATSRRLHLRRRWPLDPRVDGNGTSNTFDYDSADELFHLVNYAAGQRDDPVSIRLHVRQQWPPREHDDARRDDELRVRRHRSAHLCFAARRPNHHLCLRCRRKPDHDQRHSAQQRYTPSMT